MAVPVLLTMLTGLLYLWPRSARVVANKAVFVLVLSTAVFSLQPLIYPQVRGGAILVDAVTAAGAMADAHLTTTLVGAVPLALVTGLYISVAARGPGGPDPVA